MSRARRPVCKQMGIKKRSVLPRSRQRKISSGRGAAQASPAPSPLPRAACVKRETAPSCAGARRGGRINRGFAADACNRHRFSFLLPTRAERGQTIEGRKHILGIRDAPQHRSPARKPRADQHAMCHALGGRRAHPAARRPSIDLYLHLFCTSPSRPYRFPRSRHAWFPRRGRKAGE